MTRHSNDGLYKRCDCSHRKWSKCDHPWHFDFYYKKTAHLYGRAKHRFSLDKVADARHTAPPRSKGDAESLADIIRSEIRSGVFRYRDQPVAESADPTAPLTVGDVIAHYKARYVPVRPDDGLPRKQAAQQTMLWHLALLGRTEIPGAHGQSVRFEMKPIKEVTKADIEAVREARRRAQLEARAAREQWEAEAAELAKRGKEMERPKPRLAPGCKGGEVGINRLLERVRHLFAWAIVEGYADHHPFKRHGEVVVKLNNRVKTPRDRRLHDAIQGRQLCEEEALLQHANPHLRALIVAGISTGCRLGELLSLQWRHVEYSPGPKGERMPSSIILTNTKTNKDRRIPIDSNLRAVLQMRRTGPDGKDLGPDRYVFGNEVGEKIGRVYKAWQTLVLKAHGHKPEWVKGKKNQLSAASRAAYAAINLHFHDLRGEFGSRLVDSGASLLDTRDLLGHTDLKQTDSYLRSKSKSLISAIVRKEAHEREQQRLRQEARENNCHTEAECDNSLVADFSASDSSEVVKH